MSESGLISEPTKDQVGEYFFKFVRREFGKKEWAGIMGTLNFKEEGHPGRRSPRTLKDMSPTMGAERLWLAHGRHSAVVAMRTAVVLDLLGVVGAVRKDAITAAMLHDMTKPDEIQNRSEGGVSWTSYETTAKRGKAIMEKRGFGERVIKLSGSMGHESLLETQQILNKPELSPEDLAYLTIHAMDDLSAGDSWNKNGAFEARMDKNKTNPQLAQLNAEGVQMLGENTMEFQKKIGLRVLGQLANRLKVEVNELPVYIDQKIKEKMI